MSGDGAKPEDISPISPGSSSVFAPLSGDARSALLAEAASLRRGEVLSPAPVTLPVAQVHFSAPVGNPKDSFSPYTVRLDRQGVSLKSHVSQEETLLPLTKIFDTYPVQKSEHGDKDQLLQRAPTSHLLQILCDWRKHPSQSSDLVVTVALSSLVDCMRLVTTLTHFRTAIAEREQAAQQAVPPPRPSAEGSTSTPIWPPPLPPGAGAVGSRSGSDSLPLERLGREQTSSGATRSAPLIGRGAGGAIGGQSSIGTLTGLPPGSSSEGSQAASVEFASLYMQALPPGKFWSGGAGYVPCTLQIEPQGLVLTKGAWWQTKSAGDGPWSVPWAAVFEACIAERLPEGGRPPSSHPCVARLVVACRLGVSGCAGSALYLATESTPKVQSLLRSLVDARQRAGMTPAVSRQQASDAQRMASLGDASGQRTTNAQLSSLATAISSLKEGDPMQMMSLNNMPVPLSSNMASLLMTCNPEDSEQPDPLFLPEVWIFVTPTFHAFQRSALCLDKLGLTIRPLVAASELPEDTRLRQGALPTNGSGAVPPLQGGGGSSCSFDGEELPKDFVLVTETMNLPISSVLEVVEDNDFVFPLQPATPAPASQDAASATPGAAAAGRPQAGKAAGKGGRRAAMPFARSLVVPREQPASGTAGDGASTAPRQPKPPHPHLVKIRVKGALAGRAACGLEKAPPHMRLHAQPPPPVVMCLCFSERGQALQLVARVLEYKKYQLSIALSAHITALTAVSEREAERKRQETSADGSVVQRMLTQDRIATNNQPPPLPSTRPANIPPPK
eukprot:gnl/TRDRNA2_/TRDRNA2_167028_c0_seq3.p1 gnl/TRDRNA2_/TRDRNA2_167028_c0~~gnl/TRDRNA2_/TRDRNA2_167028_c0_seq3.p1  ORF type:complete len:787 (+),score=119.79 gnl/TRDRNA2_/TRDRNA2_167028_c0_seq3:64-2424(+)